MTGRRLRVEVLLEPGACERLDDGRGAQLVTVRLVGEDGGGAEVRLRAAEARNLAVRLLELAHAARHRRAVRAVK
jgi:hypothetical protein